MKEFKFELGQLVRHVTAIGFRRFVILGRYHYEEIGREGTIACYRCRAEDTHHIDFDEEELSALKEEAK